ncbi:MAG: HAD family hydrolase [Pseudomonadota bacterium]
MSSLAAKLVELRATNCPNGALFLDRDGVLNVDKGYVYRWRDFEWVSGAPETIRLFNEARWPVIVVTNQSGVARGYYRVEDIQTLHAQLNADLKIRGAHVDAFYHCPFHKDGIVEPFRVADHPDRKPNPGMLVRAADDYGLNLQSSIMIGDKQSDLEAADRAGARGFLFREPDLRVFVENMIHSL